jgi:hypothetical protein
MTQTSPETTTTHPEVRRPFSIDVPEAALLDRSSSASFVL